MEEMARSALVLLSLRTVMSIEKSVADGITGPELLHTLHLQPTGSLGAGLLYVPKAEAMSSHGDPPPVTAAALTASAFAPSSTSEYHSR